MSGFVARVAALGHHAFDTEAPGRVEERLALPVHVVDVADVIAVVNFGRDSDLPIAIRGGGHNGPGLGSVDKGLVIDLSAMKGVRVDPEDLGAFGLVPRHDARAAVRRAGSLTRRMIVVAAVWIALLLGVGGFTLDRILVSAITRNFDAQLDFVLTSMIASSEIGPEGEVLFNRPPADQRFLEPYSGLYYQISGEGFDPFPSRSLWDRRLDAGRPHADNEVHFYDSDEFPMETLRVAERDVRLPGSPVRWRLARCLPSALTCCRSSSHSSRKWRRTCRYMLRKQHRLT